MKNKKIIIVVIVLVMLIVAIVVYSKWKKSKEEKDDSETLGFNNSTNVPPVIDTTSVFKSLPTGAFPIKEGSKSKIVYLLQSALNKLHSSGLAVDGDFGPATKAALKANYKTEQLNYDTAKKIYLEVFAKAKSDKAFEGLINTMDSYMKF